MSSFQYSSRLNAAFRDLAVFTASTSRRGWTLDWERVADLLVVEIAIADQDRDAATVDWALPSEGISGSFDVDTEALVSELARRVGDLASELWSDAED